MHFALEPLNKCGRLYFIEPNEQNAFVHLISKPFSALNLHRITCSAQRSAKLDYSGTLKRPRYAHSPSHYRRG